MNSILTWLKLHGPHIVLLYFTTVLALVLSHTAPLTTASLLSIASAAAVVVGRQLEAMLQP